MGIHIVIDLDLVCNSARMGGEGSGVCVVGEATVSQEGVVDNA